MRQTIERALFDLQHGIWDLDVVKQQCFVSASWWRMVGFDRPAARLPFSILGDYVHPQDRDILGAKLAQVLAPGGPNFDELLRLKHSDGSFRWVRSRGHPVRDATGAANRVVGVNNDVTAQQQTRERLLRSKAFNDKLISASVDGIVAIDHAGRITAFNPAMSRMWGRAESEVLGIAMIDAFPFLVDAAAGGAFSAAVAQQKEVRWRGAYQHATSRRAGLFDASYVPLHASDGRCRGGLMRVCEASRAARRERQSQLLLDADARLHARHDLSHTLCEVVDMAASALGSWSVVLWGDLLALAPEGASRRLSLAGVHNDHAQQKQLDAWLQGPTDELSLFDGRSLPQTPESYQSEYLEHVPPHLSTRLIDPRSTEARGKRLAASCLMRIPLMVRGRLAGALTLAAETPTLEPYARGLAQMLAQRAAVAIDRAELFAQAQDAGHGREQVMARLSHNLKMPLRQIALRAQESLKTQRAGVTEELAQSVAHCARRMENLVAGILDLGNLSQGRFPLDRRTLCLGAVAADLVESLKPVAEDRGVQLHLKVAPKLPPMVGDRARLTQVITNLLDNAIKFSGTESQVALAIAAENKRITLTVTDEGPGIERALQHRLFDRLWQSPGTKRQGSGLGLYIARGIVEAHQGHIEVDSQTVGKTGTTFTITLPTAAATP